MVAIALVCAFAGSYRSHFPLPDARFGSGWGVNIHFTDEQPGEVARIAQAGFRWVRMDFAWAGIERQRGIYDFTAYDRLLTSLDHDRVRPVFILDYGNDLYEKGSPRTPESRAAFAAFVAAAVAHFRHRGVVWEMWNEPNIGFWQPAPNVDEYIALADEVGRTIRRVAPDEWYVGPATSGFDWAFLQKCFDAGLLNYWDAVSVHPYRQQAPETVLADWSRLRQMIDAKGKSVPMFSGEWGYSTAWGGMTEAKQAEYVPRQYLSNLIAGAPLSIYYDWKDDGPNPADPEHHFGATYRDMRPKPAYRAVQALSKALAGTTYRSRLAQPDPNDYVLLFRKGNEPRLVVWTTGAPHELTLPTSALKVRVEGPEGETILAGSSAGLRVSATPAPTVYAPIGRDRALEKAS